MKTSIRSLFYPAVTSIALSFSLPSEAGSGYAHTVLLQQTGSQTGTAATPLDKVSAVYTGYKTIEADFSFRYYHNEEDQTGQGEQGKLWLEAASGSYRISTPTQEMISDGKTQWAVLKEADEVQITDTEQQEGSITPSNIFTFFQKGYTHKTLSDQQAGSLRLTVVELTPQDSKKNYSKIIARINKSNNQLYDVTIYDKNKSRYTYQIQQLKANQTISDGHFTFDKSKYPGMEIVDLR